MVYRLWFPIYVGKIKPERKCVCFRLLLGLLFEDCPNVVRLYSIEELVSVWFYFYIHFHYRIRFNAFQYEIRF